MFIIDNDEKTIFNTDFIEKIFIGSTHCHNDNAVFVQTVSGAITVIAEFKDAADADAVFNALLRILTSGNCDVVKISDIILELAKQRFADKLEKGVPMT